MEEMGEEGKREGEVRMIYSDLHRFLRSMPKSYFPLFLAKSNISFRNFCALSVLISFRNERDECVERFVLGLREFICLFKDLFRYLYQGLTGLTGFILIWGGRGKREGGKEEEREGRKGERREEKGEEEEEKKKKK